MKKAVLGFAVFLMAPIAAQANETPTITASPAASSTAGQIVTFTAAFTYDCADGVAEQHFLVDGTQVPSTTFSQHNPNATATLVISSLSVGSHTIGYHWESAPPTLATPCSFNAHPLNYTVKPRPAPPPPPAAKPSPVPSSTASPSPSPSTPESPSPSAAPTASSERSSAARGYGPGQPPIVPLSGGTAAVLLIGAGWLAIRRLAQR